MMILNMGVFSCKLWYSNKNPNSKERKVSEMDAYEKIVEFFSKSDEPVSAGQVADATGVDRKEVDKVMKQLKNEEKIVSPKRCYWQYNK